MYLFKFASIKFLSYIIFELFDVEHGNPISHKNVKCNYLGLALAIDPISPRGNFVHFNFQILHYISHKMKYVSLLRVAVLAGLHHVTHVNCKITLNFPDHVSNMTYSHFFEVRHRSKNF